MSFRLHSFLPVLCLATALLSWGLAAAGEELPAEERQRLRALCFRLGENEPGKKWDAARELIQAGPKAAPVIAEVLKGDWLEGRRMAAWILSEIHDVACVAPLAKALEDPDEQVRWKAAVGLKQVGKVSVFALVAELLTGNLPAKHCAAWTLGELADAGGAGSLASTLDDKDEDLRWKAAISLTQIGAPSLPALTEALDSKSVDARRCAIWAIGKIGGDAALPALERALADPDNLVRAKAVVALGNIPGEAATKLLLRMVRDTDPVVRKDAIVALGRRGRALTPTARPDKTAAEPTTEVPLFGICEVAFKPTKIQKKESARETREKTRKEEGTEGQLINPFADASITGTFVAPDDRNIQVAGFFAGDGTWKVRAALDQEGLWYYRIDFKAGETAEIAHGGAKCTAAKDRPARGFLRVDKANPRVLTLNSGPRFYPIGSGTEGLSAPKADGTPANTLDAWKAYLDDCAKGGMNRCRIFLLEVPWTAPENVKAHPELSPWPFVVRPSGRIPAGRAEARTTNEAYDLTRFSLPFWDKLDAVLTYGAERGIVFELTVFDETGLASGEKDCWALHPFNQRNGGTIGGVAGCPAFYDLTVAPNRAAQEAYVRYLLARTGAYANVYYELNNEMNRRGAAGNAGIRWAEHWASFFREHDPFSHLISLSVAENPGGYYLIDGIHIANVHGEAPPEPQGIRMPVVLDEARVQTPREERAIFWQALLLGTSAARAPWQGLAARSPMFEHARHLADFIRDIPWWELRRDTTSVLMAPGGVQWLAAARDGELIVYLRGAADQGQIRLGVANTPYDVTWFDPKSGRTVRTEQAQPNQGALDLACPTFEEDIVLRIRRK